MLKVPEEAVHVTVVSPLGTPWRRFTVPYGIPVGVSKAGRSLSPTSKAKSTRGQCFINKCCNYRYLIAFHCNL